MATLKLTLDKRRMYNDGSHPLIFRLTHNRKSTSIHLGIKLYKKEWDKSKLRIRKCHPNFKHLNLELRKRQSELELTLIKTSCTIQELSVWYMTSCVFKQLI
jgi:hypothetical protein